jgi:hypothetical protein
VRPVHTLTAVGGLAVALVLASAATAQDDPFGGLQPHYWPHRKFVIPVEDKALSALNPKPTHIQLYSAVSRGPFQKAVKVPLNELQESSGKKGILFEAPRDGDYEFAAQFVYADGTVSPPEKELGPQIRAIIDTVPPRVQLAAVGNGVEWLATDENLDPRYITLQCKWPSSSDWTTITDKTFRASDNYSWKMPAGKVLEVRVLAKDRAGNEGVSPVVRVPGDAAAVGLPKTGPTWVAPGTGAAPPQSRIDYVNELDFNVDYTVQRMGRSGVQAAHLFVLKDRGNWELVKRFPVKLMPDDKGPHSMSLPYKAATEGTYGFYVIPESGAGKKADDPKRDDPPMVIVVVDTTKPYIQITGVQVKPGGVRGPLVEFTWKSADANPMPQPISLEWSLDKTAAKWNEVKYRLENNLTAETGRYAWEVPDEKLWKFWVRARAVDKAGNVGEFVWPQEVIVDLEKPSATIDRVRGGGTAPKAPPEKPPAPVEKPPEPDNLP